MTKGVKQAQTIWINQHEAKRLVWGEEKLVLVKGSIQRVYKVIPKTEIKSYDEKLCNQDPWSQQPTEIPICGHTNDRQRAFATF